MLDKPARPVAACALAIAAMVAVAGAACAQETPSGDESAKAPVTPQAWAWHVQATDILQAVPSFHSPYAGPNSFQATGITGNTLDATLYLGVRPWTGAELWGDLEAYQGYAPSNTLGVAGYVNGDGAKVGRAHPYGRIARLFLRQTFDLGGGADHQDADLNQLAAHRSKDRLVVTAGKLSVQDIFDANKYAHDPRADFLNWSLITAGSFDYAADAWGYTYGAAAEWYRGDWTWRAGVFDLSVVPNNAILTSDFHQFQLIGEAERRYELGGRPGAVRLTGFVSRGRMALYDDATALARATGTPADVAKVRRYAGRPGVHLSVEQEVADGVGVFGRLGWADGRYEGYEYTDIDATVQAGVSLSGRRWGRRDDTLAAAVVVNQLSKAGQRYLDAGGLGILVGDGRLPHPGTEDILEADYSFAFAKDMTLSLDDQVIAHPAYNRDRGPANVVSLRLHLQR
ncbi:MAG: carbohydrate porin [Proteobacteria bacterium]|nr:carbohydrate porin [Pseudomonadota bacterium]